MCDHVFGESGEFDILPTLQLIEPTASTTYNLASTVTVKWASHYIIGSPLTLELYTAGPNAKVWTGQVLDTGYYNFFVPYDMAEGMYYFKISSTELASKSAFVAADTTVSDSSVPFTILHTGPLPPSPSPAPHYSPPPNLTPWEVPIIKAFRSSFELDDVKQSAGANYDYSHTSTVAGGN